MSDADDRLAGDPMWELFPSHVSGPLSRGSRARRLGQWTASVVTVAAVWLLHPPAAVLVACVLVAVPDFLVARRLRRAVPDKAGGTICTRFAYAWATFKSGVAAAVLLFAGVFLTSPNHPRFVWGALTALLLSACAFTMSSAWTALGLVAAFRSGMRVWIGEGINQARTLMLGMLLTVFGVGMTLVVFVLLLADGLSRSESPPGSGAGFFLIWMAYVVCGPFVILAMLDRLSDRILANHPGKFGAKVPTVGKWNDRTDP